MQLPPACAQRCLRASSTAATAFRASYTNDLALVLVFPIHCLLLHLAKLSPVAPPGTWSAQALVQYLPAGAGSQALQAI